VLFTGFVSQEDLNALYSAATVFAFPSLAEGFGLPVLEAMARGVPVACSNASSLPEVAGDAALLFDPREETAIAAAVRRVLASSTEVDRLRARGFVRAKEFTWERTARATLACYTRALSARA
jgi:glycosyltransferase involved in cell wall biosynthesis